MTTPHPALAAVSSLDAIADGQLLDGLPRPVLAELFERASVAAARLEARLLGTTGPAPASEPDRVLGIDEAAGMLGMSTDFLYRNWHKLGLGYKDADRHVKFPLSRVQRYIRSRAGR